MATKTYVLILLLFSTQLLYSQDIVINEILASSDSTSGISDARAEYEDWLELYNTSSSDVDLGGWSLSDDILDLDKWSFPAGTTIAAQSYLIIWCDNDSFQNGLHAYFKLAKSGEIVSLSNSAGAVIDQVAYEQQTTNVSWSRIPNGTGAFDFDEPTHSCSNDANYGPLLMSSSLAINEVLAASDSTGSIVDPSGDVEDWVELINMTNQPIDLYGYFLSDNPANRFKWKIPYGTNIPANDYLIFWCDNDQEEEGLHTNFNLSSSGESMLLSYDDASIVDITTWAIQSANTSYARMPNGTGAFQVDNTPSFAESNDDTSIGEYFDNRINAYPSPVKDILHLSVSSLLLSDKLELDLVDMSGRIWLSKTIAGSESDINIPSAVPSGLYFILLEMDSGQIIRKIIVE